LVLCCYEGKNNSIKAYRTLNIGDNQNYYRCDTTVTKKGDIKPPFSENKISLGLLEF